MTASRPSLLSRILPRSLEHQLMVLTASCLVASILGYGAYTAKRQTDIAQATITAQMAALAQNLATIDAYFLLTKDLAGIESITLQTATVPGIFSVLVTDARGNPLSEVVNRNGTWSPRYGSASVSVPPWTKPITVLERRKPSQTEQDFLAGTAGKISSWHPISIHKNPMGWVRVSYRLDNLDQAERDIWQQAFLVMGLAIGTTLALLFWLLRAPMRALQAATQFAADLDHTLGREIQVSSRAHEVEELGHALNAVSHRLFNQNHDLNNQKFALDQHAIVSITDLDGTITYANDRFCEISGYSREELLGQNHRVVKSNIHPLSLYVDMWTTIASGKVWNGEIQNRKKDGSPYWVSATIVPLMGPNGLPQQYIGIRTDISAIKALEQTLKEAKTAAEAANKAKSDFLANMSHEIRTPMNGVIGMTELALDTPLDATQRSYLSTVQSSAYALLDILNEILDFSKIEAGKIAMEHVKFDLHKVITESIKSIEARTLKKQLSLHYELPDTLVTQVKGDPGRIRQVLTNLCDNAIKFTQQGGLTVRVKQSSGQQAGFVTLQISVSDTGIGIAHDKQALIFAAFSQADTSTTRQFGGTGLGLTICARLVEMMGGRIWVESSLGQGSTFHFTVQLETVATPALATITPPSNTAVEPGAQRPLLVMLVEDNAINQMLATTLLKKWGHTVVLAQNGQEAVDLYTHAAWDVILMDMQMPVMGGLEATVQIRAKETPQRRVPIIAVTANAMETDREACAQAGMDDHLPKPIKPAALQALLLKYCGA